MRNRARVSRPGHRWAYFATETAALADAARVYDRTGIFVEVQSPAPSLLTLKREAGRAARHRGHDLRDWQTFDPRTARATCRHCPAWVQVETHPAPNSIDIGGPAVAGGCHPDRMPASSPSVKSPAPVGTGRAE